MCARARMQVGFQLSHDFYSPLTQKMCVCVFMFAEHYRRCEEEDVRETEC